MAAIRTGCNMLAEGKAEIDKFKKTVEKGVGDAKAIYTEVVGIWGWLQSLFGKKPEPKQMALPVVEPKSQPQVKKSAKTKREPEVELTYEEFQARQVHEICENLKV
ncbi:MAG: hypothetical protein ACO222_07990, partial [Polynucleobacter sp.]